jgi:hypothetical protein
MVGGLGENSPMRNDVICPSPKPPWRFRIITCQMAEPFKKARDLEFEVERCQC